MPVTAPRWRFTEAMILDAPDCPGVYVLWRDGVALGVGHALGALDTIRSRLRAHLSHAATTGLGVTHYSWLICTDPLRQELEISRQLGLSGRPAASSGTPSTTTPNNTNSCRHAESGSSSSTT